MTLFAQLARASNHWSDYALVEADRQVSEGEQEASPELASSLDFVDAIASELNCSDACLGLPPGILFYTNGHLGVIQT